MSRTKDLGAGDLLMKEMMCEERKDIPIEKIHLTDIAEGER